MKLYLISQEVNGGYDTYDSAVVAAKTEDDAKRIHPSDAEDDDWYKDDYIGTWCMIEDVQVELIGAAEPNTERCVMCASFNAG